MRGSAEVGFLPERLAREALERTSAARTTSRSRVESGAAASAARAVSRRRFVQVSAAAGGGLLLTIHLPGCGGDRGRASGAEDARVPSAHGTPAPEDGFAPGAWVTIHPDGTATITVAKSEMGQGVRTTLALIVAEELDLDWDRVRVRQAPADEETYGRQGTGGSASVRTSWATLREAGATARAMLMAAAARELGVPAEELSTEASHVVHAGSGRRMSYGDLAERAAQEEVPQEVSLKPPEEWRLLGRKHVGVDARDIVTGRAEYGLDARMDGMLYAAVARSPSHGGRLRRYDASRALQVPGVRQVVEVPAVGNGVNVHAGVAVVAENSWAAFRGCDALGIEWDRGPGGSDTSEAYTNRMREVVRRPGAATVNRVGDPDRQLELAAPEARHSATYEVPFISHATMEPQNCTAHVQGDRCVVRAPTQFPNWARGAVAEALEMSAENVEVSITLLGGGYGRRINPDYAVEAALVARQVDAPVKVVWSREDDLRHDFYRPPAVHRIDAVVGPDGYPATWRHRFSTAAISGTYEERVDQEAFGVSEADGAGNMSYRVPHRSCEYTYLPSHITRGWWRAVHTTHGTFAVESFIDELAERAGIDPLEYRLALIDELPVDRPGFPDEFPFQPERLKGVLRLAAEKAGWGRRLREGHAMGIACGIDHLTYAADVVEVSVRGDEVRIEKVVVAADCGPVLNPDLGRAQLQGGALQGISAALGEKLTVRDGAIVEGNFDEYPLLRMRDAPRVVEAYFMETDTHPTGLGEPAVPPAAPALANAIYAATGVRHRTLPIRGDRTG